MFSSEWGVEDYTQSTISFTPLELMVLEHALLEGGLKQAETIKSVLGETAAKAMLKAYEKIAEAIENQ